MNIPPGDAFVKLFANLMDFFLLNNKNLHKKNVSYKKSKNREHGI